MPAEARPDDHRRALDPQVGTLPEYRWRVQDEFGDAEVLEIGLTSYVCDDLPMAGVSWSERQFPLVKPRAQVERYLGLLDGLRPRTIVELGVYLGGSTAFLVQAARPRRLVTIERETSAPRALEAFLRSSGFDKRVSCHWGIDQADRAALRSIMTDEFSDSPVDLIIDDASHALFETRSSFEVLFPRLRPGGVYVIEDWSWAHRRFPDGYEIGITPDQSLSVLALELMFVTAHRPDIVSDIDIERGWLALRRGHASLPPDGWVTDAVGAVGRGRINRIVAPRHNLTVCDPGPRA